MIKVCIIGFVSLFISCKKNLQKENKRIDNSTFIPIWQNESKYLLPPCDSIMKNILVDLIPTDTIIDKIKYTHFIEGFDSKLYLHDDKIWGFNYPIIISKDTVVYLYRVGSVYAGYEYWDGFTSNSNRQYMYFSSYYLTGDINSQYEDENGTIVIPESILRFGCAYMLNMQNGKLKYFMYYLDGYWNNCDQWVISSDDQELAFDAELDDNE